MSSLYDRATRVGAHFTPADHDSARRRGTRQLRHDADRGRAAAAIARGWSSARPHDIVISCARNPTAGRDSSTVLPVPGSPRDDRSRSPGDPVTARWRVDGDTAYVESAQACGLHLVGVPTVDSAVRASSTGLSELIAAVVEGRSGASVGRRARRLGHH